MPTEAQRRTEPGDHTDRQILRFRRIRAERQEVLAGDSAPLLCRRGTKLLLCGRAGSLARSSNGGVTWERLGSLRDHESPNHTVSAANHTRRVSAANHTRRVTSWRW